MKIRNLIFLTAASVLIFTFYFFYQPVITYSKCKLCDGNQYISMYQFFEGQTETFKANFPYYSRIVVPLFAALVPGEGVLWGFQVVNLLFCLLGVTSIYIAWQKLSIPWYLVVIGLFWLLFHWTGMVRLNAMDPITVDMPLYLIHTLLILIFLYKKFNWLILLGPAAVLQKESIIVLLLVFLLFALINNILFREERIPLLSIILSIIFSVILKYIFTQQFPPLEPGYSSVRLVLFYLKEIVYDPFRLLRWITGLFMAYGAFLLLPVFQLKKIDFFDRTMAFLTLMSAVSFLLSVIGGQDHTRIAFLGFPFVMTWILILAKDQNWKIIVTALILSLPLMRIFGKIPDPGQDFYNFAQWYPEYAPVPVVVGLAGYLALTSLLLVVTHFILKGKG